MILVGVENCSSCKIARSFLPDIPYIVLKKGIRSDRYQLEIKRAIGKLNVNRTFPVLLNQEMDKLIDTKFLLDNLNTKKLRNKFQNLENKIKTI